jgi:hypothetical protein
MQRLFYLLLSCAMLFPTATYAISDAAARRFVLENLKKYAPEGYYIIHTYQKMPLQIKSGKSFVSISKTDFMNFARLSSKQELVTSMETIVHETVHGYQGRRAYEILKEQGRPFSSSPGYLTIYAGEGRDIIIKKTPVFRTRKMASSIPSPLRSFRYYTYINTKRKHLGSQQWGAYGLLDELSAYYYGTRTSFMLLKNFDEIFDERDSDWRPLITRTMGTYYAHNEFKYYILAYMGYAKKNHPSVFRELIDNKNFIRAFFSIESKFTALNKELFTFSFLRESGYTVHHMSNNIRLTKAGRSPMYIGSFRDLYGRLGKEMEKKQYRDLLSLMRRRAGLTQEL